MSNLPPGWALAYPDDIKADSANSLAIGPFGSNLKVSDYRDAGVPLVFVRNIRAQVFAPSDLKFVSKPKAESLRAHIVRQGDLLITKMGDPPGDAAIYPLPEEGIITADCIKLTPNLSIDARYLLYALSAPAAKRQIIQITQGVAQPKMSLARFRHGVQIPLAPTAEQKRIVAAIEEQFSRLDAGVAALKRVRQNLKRMRATVLEAAVTGRLLDGGVADDGADRGAASIPPPSGWSVVAVDDVAEVSGGITKTPKRVPGDNAFPFLRVANVMRDRLDLSEVHQIEVFAGELERFRLQRGDLLVVEGNGSADQIGRSALWDGSIDPCVHQNHLIRVRPGSEILPEYLNIFWNAPSSMATIQAAASSTSGLHTLSTGKVRGVRVVLPPLPVQHRIVEEVHRQLSALSALDHQLGIEETRGRRLRAAILAAAFSGNLTPQDPSEEPASVLLERIAAERATSNGHTSKRGRKPRALREEVTA